MERNWYAIRTYTGQEEKIKENLENQIEALGLKDKIFQVVVPTQEESKIAGGKRKRVKSKLYPGYVFIEMILDDESWHVVRNMPGTMGFVGAGGKAIPLQEREIANILGTEARKLPKVAWLKGESVRILRPNFQDMIGKIEEIDLVKERLRILVPLFGRETPMELGFDEVEKL